MRFADPLTIRPVLAFRAPASRRPEPRAAIRRAVLALLAILFLAPAMPARAQVVPTEYEGAASIGLPLRQLGTSKRVLMIAAHPDDEATQVLSALALGQGADVAYLSLTRGEGGQNGIGGELQEGLGLLRSEELLAARRLDGAAQYFSRAVDYGFSKDAEEAFRHWPRDDLLRDVVAVIRHFRPDVIVSVFTGTPRDGHGQHQAAGIMAREGFAAAPDVSRFPELLAAGLRPHAPVHLFQLLRGPDDEPVAEVDTGVLDPLLGRSHFQVAMASRSRHRSQDMGRPLTPGPQSTSLVLADTRARTPVTGIFSGVDTTLATRLRSTTEQGAGESLLKELLTRYQQSVSRARDTFNALHPERSVHELVTAAGLLEEALRVPGGDDEHPDRRFLLEAERAKIASAIRRASLIEVDAIAADELVVPGQVFEVELRLWNGGAGEVAVAKLELELPAGWSAIPLDSLQAVLSPGEIVTRRFEVSVADSAEPTEPYFLRTVRDGARYRWPSDIGPVGIPFERDPVGFTAHLVVEGLPIEQTGPARFLGVDSRSGEYRRPIRTVPPVALTVEPTLTVLPLERADRPVPVTVAVSAEEPNGVAGELRLEVTDGWRAEPAALPLVFAGEGEERIAEFRLFAPPQGLTAGPSEISAVFQDENGRRFERGFTLVDYPHIRPRPLYRPSTVTIQAVDVEVPTGIRVGYVAAVGDNVPAALTQLGIQVELLGEGALASAPLDGFDVVVIGSRAYEGRPDLVTHNQRLLDYVSRGGTMIVQYNQYQYTEPGIAPRPVTMARPHDRVTDENAEVRVLDPDHPIFNRPNRIGPEDFAGWVQERGLYFLNSWDDAYTPLLEMADPGEEPKRGSLLIARHGNGTYVYTGLALFRQLPAGVPGAYRLFANLLALGVE